MRDTILVIDDVDINRAVLYEILSEDYDIIEAKSSAEAIKILFRQDRRISMILLDIMIADLNDFELLHQIQFHTELKKIPVIVVTGGEAEGMITITKGIAAGAADYILRPFNQDIVLVRVHNYIQLMHYRNDVERAVEDRAYELMKNYHQVLENLVTFIEYRDTKVGTHVQRITQIVKFLVEQMRRKPKYRDELIDACYQLLPEASALHDIGKIGIADTILLKPSKLTTEEFEMMKSHSIMGANIIGQISQNLPGAGIYFKLAKEICRSHHERWDGKGYPDGLKGEAIPLSARILSVVDVYDALINKRVYKPAFTHEETLKVIRDGSGTLFDPGIVKIFMEISRQAEELEGVMGEI